MFPLCSGCWQVGWTDWTRLAPVAPPHYTGGPPPSTAGHHCLLSSPPARANPPPPLLLLLILPPLTTTTTPTTTPEDTTTVSWWVLAGWCWFVLSRGAERSSSVSGAWSLEFSTAPCYPGYCSSPARHVAMLVSLVIVNITGPTPTLASGHTPLLVTSQ